MNRRHATLLLRKSLPNFRIAKFDIYRRQMRFQVSRDASLTGLTRNRHQPSEKHLLIVEWWILSAVGHLFVSGEDGKWIGMVVQKRLVVIFEYQYVA
jgi:hypothetical protein